jgi:hypothetical protein
MDNNSTYSRIYELKTQGLDKVLTDIANLTAQFQKLGSVKDSLFSGNADDISKSLAQVTKALTDMTSAANSGGTSMQSLSQIMASMQSTGVASFTQIAAAAEPANNRFMQAGFTMQKVTQSMTEASASTADFQTKMTALADSMNVLIMERSRISKELKETEDYLATSGGKKDYGAAQDRMESLTVALAQVKSQIGEVNSAMMAMSKVNNPGLTDEQKLGKALDSQTLAEQNAMLRALAKEQLATAGSMNEARAQAGLLRKELNDLNITTEEGKNKAAELRAEIERLDKFVEQNADAFTKRKINIGNYQADFSAALKENAQQLSATVNNLYSQQPVNPIGFRANKDDAGLKAMADGIVAVNSELAKMGSGINIVDQGFQTIGFRSQKQMQEIADATAQLNTQLKSGVGDTQALEEQFGKLQTLLEQIGLGINTVGRSLQQLNSTAEASKMLEEFNSLNKVFGQMNANHPDYAATKTQLEGMAANLNEIGIKAKVAGEGLSLMDKVGKKFTLDSMITRTATSLARMIPHMVVFTLLFEGINKVSDAIMEAIPGTDKYVEHQEKIAQANEHLRATFTALAEEVNKFNEVYAKSSDYRYNDMLGLSDNSLDALKRKENAIKAIGVVNGEVYAAERSQLDAANEVRKKEIEAINDQLETYKKLYDVINSRDEGGRNAVSANMVSDEIKKSGLPKEMADKFVADFEKQVKDGGSLSKAVAGILRAFEAKMQDMKESAANTSAQILDSETALTSKMNAALYAKSADLEKQLLQMKEQYREKAYAYDIQRNGETEETIKADTTAKYKLMLSELRKERDEFLKQFPKGSQGSGVLNAMKEYDGKEAAIRRQRDQEQRQRTQQLNDLRQMQQLEEKIRLAKDEASRSEFSAGFGAANYNRMSKAIDSRQYAENLEAQKTYIENKKKLQAQGVRDFSKLDEDAAKDAVIRDQKYYQLRLQAAKDYYAKQFAQIASEHTRITLGMDSDLYKKQTDIMTGSGGVFGKVRKLDKAQEAAQEAKADYEVANARRMVALATQQQAQAERELAEAKAKYGKDSPQAEAARLSFQDASDQYATQQNALQDAMKKRAEIDFESQKKKAAEQKELLSEGLDYLKQSIDQEMQLLEQQSQMREEMAQRQLDYTKKVQDADAQSKRQQHDNEIANMVAERQIHKQRMEDQKRQAEAQAAIDYSSAAIMMIVKTMDDSVGYYDYVAKLAVGEAMLAGTFAAKMAMLESAPTYAQGTDDHPGGFAWVGDGYQREMIKIGNDFYMSPDVPTLVNMPRGSQVTPMSQLGGTLQPPSYTPGGGGVPSGLYDAINALTANVAALQQSHQETTNHIRMMSKSISNMQVNFDTVKGKTALNKAYFKTIKL